MDYGRLSMMENDTQVEVISCLAYNFTPIRAIPLIPSRAHARVREFLRQNMTDSEEYPFSIQGIQKANWIPWRPSPLCMRESRPVGSSKAS
jgi:hypothetical protein